MGQLVAQGVVIVVLMSLATSATTMTSIVTDRDRDRDRGSLRAAVYILTPKSRIQEAKSTALRLFLEGADGDKWSRITRNGAVSSGRMREAVFKCRELVPWAWSVIQTIVKSKLEDTYYHVPRPSPDALPSGLHIQNMLVPTFIDRQHPRCHPNCPVRLRLLPPEPDRLWPRNLVVAECACKETSCFSRGQYQCGEVTAPVLIVRGEPGQNPRYCPEMVPAGCRCIPVRIMPASRFDPYARDGRLSDVVD